MPKPEPEIVTVGAVTLPVKETLLMPVNVRVNFAVAVMDDVDPVTVGLAAITAGSGTAGATSAVTSTPIKHVVVVFQENVSFDHYFGTYPNATNPQGGPKFQASIGTPNVNGLSTALLTANPNGENPNRLDRSQAIDV